MAAAALSASGGLLSFVDLNLSFLVLFLCVKLMALLQYINGAVQELLKKKIN